MEGEGVWFEVGGVELGWMEVGRVFAGLDAHVNFGIGFIAALASFAEGRRGGEEGGREGRDGGNEMSWT